MPNYPTSLDALANPTSTTLRNDPGFSLAGAVSTLNDIAEAIEAKVGIGASVPGASAAVLRRTAAGSSAWGPIDAADLAAGMGMRKLFDSTLGAAVATIDMPSISQAYAHLILSVVGTNPSAPSSCYLRYSFDGTTFDATGPYDWINTNQATGAPTGVGSAAGGDNAMLLGAFAQSYQNGLLIDIPQYGTSGLHFVHGRTWYQGSPGTTGSIMQTTAGVHRTNVNPVRGLRLYVSAGQFSIGTRVVLHGTPGTAG